LKMNLSRDKRKIVRIILSVLIGLNILAWIAVYELSSLNFVEVNFFDVGQGDAIFIQTDSLQQILIDGGPGKKVLKKIGREMPFWDKSIDAIILTHIEEDHVTGLIEVMERYEVDYVLWNGISKNSSRSKRWRKMIKGKKELIASEGLEMVLGKGRSVKILYPFEGFKKEGGGNINNSSIVIRLKAKENSFLLTGDAYKVVELKLLSQDIESDVLKVGHHGSKTSTAEKFLEKVSPEFGVISCGKDNRHGHPHQEVLENLEKYDIKVLRTDKVGDIKFISDNKNNLRVTGSK